MQRRIVIINGHPVHISIEAQFWECLADIAHHKSRSLSALVREIADKVGGDLPSSLRVFVLSYYKFRTTSEVTSRSQVYH